MTVEIHTVMQNTRDLQAISMDAVDEEVAGPSHQAIGPIHAAATEEQMIRADLLADFAATIASDAIGLLGNVTDGLAY